MKSKLSNVNFTPPPRFVAAVVAARLDGASSYRLKCVETARYFPALDHPAAPCGPGFAKPLSDLVAGTYQIVYYADPQNPESVIPWPGREPPILQVSQDTVLVTPAEHEIAELRRWQEHEKNEVKGRHRESMARTIESLTSVNERLTQNAIERDAAMTELMVKFAGLQAQIATAQASMISGYDAQGESLRKNFVAFSDTAQEAMKKIKTDNLYSLGSEVVKSVTSIYETSINARAETRLDRRLRTSEPHGALEGRRHSERDEAKPRSRPEEPPPPPPPPPPVSSASPPAAPAVAAKSLSVEIDWLEVYDAPPDSSDEGEAPASPPAARMAETEEPAARIADEEPAAPTSVAMATLPEEITDLVSQVPELEQLLAALGIVDDEVERPAEWSYSWAWEAIRRRIANLSDASIAWLLSSFDNALMFVRQLADLATPPPDREPEGSPC